MVAADDLGRAINPLTAESQIDGGVMLGLGFGLAEEQMLDKSTGICVNPNHLNYKVPSIKEVPEIVPILVESVDKVGPFGAKGMGEPACSSARAGHRQRHLQRHRRALYGTACRPIVPSSPA